MSTSSARRQRKWSQHVTESSDALDLRHGIFDKSPQAIARSLKSSAEHSKRRKSAPFRSAMSMLNFYINRAGKSLSATRRARLGKAKNALRKAFGKPTIAGE
ncbi:DUF3175 domain-containing protein [Variovorax sp. dw_954]|uniref:DUF3175 domain-containing protein n=1 Tax=Variovorax sp. dw_954 TaxID=2720078 RepID=UPI001BD6B64F|nr:DUF3175 domain-containing protein [Variovorax sp. dw_954]